MHNVVIRSVGWAIQKYDIQLGAGRTHIAPCTWYNRTNLYTNVNEIEISIRTVNSKVGVSKVVERIAHA